MRKEAETRDADGYAQVTNVNPDFVQDIEGIFLRFSPTKNMRPTWTWKTEEVKGKIRFYTRCKDDVVLTLRAIAYAYFQGATR